MNGTRYSRSFRDGWLSRERAVALLMLAATGVGIYVCYLLARPFLSSLAWALALALAAVPLHERIEIKTGRRGLAAGLSVFLIAVVVVVPATFVIQSLLQEAASGAEAIQKRVTTGEWRSPFEGRPRLASAVRWIEQQLNLPEIVGRISEIFTTGVTSFVKGSVVGIIQLLITFYFLFYFLRDRDAAIGALRSWMPLSIAETDRIFRRVVDTIYATIYGTLVVAFVQGTLGGLMFWWLGLPAPALWGFVMALLAIVPVLGAFIVWIPAAIFLAVEGSWGKALLLSLWGGVVIGLIDNILYPVLIGRRVQVHTVPVFIAIVGGLLVFGASGLIIGPVMMAVTIALLEIWRGRIKPANARQQS